MPANASANNLNAKQFVDIHDIRDDVVVLKNGSLRLLIEVGSVNFDLKSSDEQMAIINGFKNFINSLDFPLQIVVHSRNLDIAGYLARTQETVQKIENELLRIQGVEYIKFVGGLIELANVMSKRFYIAVPFYIVESGDNEKGFWEKAKTVFGSAKGKVAKIEEKNFSAYQSQINRRASIIFDGLQGIGLTSHIVKTDELISLFSSLYNPHFNV